MELMQLQMFVAVVEEQSVRGAAERVLRTQPAVSIAMRKLEEEFSTPLFDRSKRYEYRLTPAGEVMYAYAARLVSLRNEAISAGADLGNLRTGQLRVGANESISMHLLPGEETWRTLSRDKGFYGSSAGEQTAGRKQSGRDPSECCRKAGRHSKAKAPSLT
jgi:hypothetical protein